MVGLFFRHFFGSLGSSAYTRKFTCGGDIHTWEVSDVEGTSHQCEILHSLYFSSLSITTGIFVRFRKGRRKNEKDAPSPNPDEQREYLIDDYIKDKISDCDLNKLVTLPVGLDYNEWLATHSKWIIIIKHVCLKKKNPLPKTNICLFFN